MSDLATLQSELKAVLDRRTEIELSYRDAPRPPHEATEELERLAERGMKIHALMEDARAEKRASEFARLGAYMDNPSYLVARGAPSDENGERKMIESMGFEIKGGGLYFHSPSIKDVDPMPFVAEDVLWGPLPREDHDSLQYCKQMRTVCLNPEYRTAYWKWFKSPFRSDSMAFATLTTSEQKALSEGQDTAGGFIAPPDLQGELLVRTGQQAVMRKLCRTVNTSRDRVQFPRVLPHASLGSIYSSGFVGSMVGETPAFSDTDPSFGLFDINIKDARTATRLSNNLINDAAFNVPAWLAENGAQNLALVEDNQFLNGDGAALNVMGILNAGLTTVDVEGTTTNTISNTTTDLGSGAKIITLVYTVPAQYAANSSFVFSRSTEGKIRKLVNAQNGFLWPEAAGSAFGTVPRSLLGYPLYDSDFMPNDGTDTNKVILYGDFSAYIIAQRAQISTVVLRERFADTNQTGIIIFERFGGGLWNTDALRVGVV